MSASTSATAPVTTIKLPVLRWAAWANAHADQAKPDLSFVDPMLRRRLSPLARAAFDVAQRCSEGAIGIPLVYASRHGELARTVELLQAIAQNEPLSPTTFGLSVLNASAGLYSITRNDTAPSSALASGAETFGFGLIEAWSRMQTTGKAVLYIYADMPVPAPLPACEQDVQNVLALGLLLDPASSTQIECSVAPNAGDQQSAAATPLCQASTFMEFLAGKESTHWTSDRRTWRWSH